jgi:hypothetical protein
MLFDFSNEQALKKHANNKTVDMLPLAILSSLQDEQAWMSL